MKDCFQVWVHKSFEVELGHLDDYCKGDKIVDTVFDRLLVGKKVDVYELSIHVDEDF